MQSRGKVIKNQNNKTIAVSIEKRKVNKKYGKSFRIYKTYQVHIDDEQSVSIGDIVDITTCRPISKTKKWKFINKVES